MSPAVRSRRCADRRFGRREVCLVHGRQDRRSALDAHVLRDEMGLTGPVVGSSSSMWEVRRLIVAGFGIGCLPEHVAQDDVEQGRLQRLPPEAGVADVDMHLLWMADRKFSAAEAAFLEALHRFIDARYPETASGTMGGQ
ncbi:LysR substrate-binding domain-containing protein [Ralstonia sp. 1B3]|uniref:LysR substrate-binding domain-containing protein n=1 Tax=Ralstonia sp. 1B3 TaxID=2997421 RepID=UPI002FCC81B7